MWRFIISTSCLIGSTLWGYHIWDTGIRTYAYEYGRPQPIHFLFVWFALVCILIQRWMGGRDYSSVGLALSALVAALHPFALYQHTEKVKLMEAGAYLIMAGFGLSVLGSASLICIVCMSHWPRASKHT